MSTVSNNTQKKLEESGEIIEEHTPNLDNNQKENNNENKTIDLATANDMNYTPYYIVITTTFEDIVCYENSENDNYWFYLNKILNGDISNTELKFENKDKPNKWLDFLPNSFNMPLMSVRLKTIISKDLSNIKSWKNIKITGNDDNKSRIELLIAGFVRETSTLFDDKLGIPSSLNELFIEYHGSLLRSVEYYVPVFNRLSEDFLDLNKTVKVNKSILYPYFKPNKVKDLPYLFVMPAADISVVVRASLSCTKKFIQLIKDNNITGISCLHPNGTDGTDQVMLV